MVRALCLAAVLVILAGCTSSSNPPQKLVGLSVDEVKAKLGAPRSQTRVIVPQNGSGLFGPRPASLQPGDRYISLYYNDCEGEQIHVYAVSPVVYQRVKGESPGTKMAYVLEVRRSPKGAVF